MKYRGRVERGLVVLDRSLPLRDGTIVDVEPISTETMLDAHMRPPRGSALAVLRHAGIWSAESEEVDHALAELRGIKEAEVATQIGGQ